MHLKQVVKNPNDTEIGTRVFVSQSLGEMEWGWSVTVLPFEADGRENTCDIEL